MVVSYYFLLLVLSSIHVFPAMAGVSYGFYNTKCPNLEQIVAARHDAAVKNDPTVSAALLRLPFADCFVNGCDGSVLLGPERGAPVSATLRGFDVIDDIKSHVEQSCPGVVSCTDILLLAGRQAVISAGGPAIPLKLGRKDGRGSYPALAATTMPLPSDNVATLITKFQNVGLDIVDLVALSGAHTIGRASCSSVPNIPRAFVKQLGNTCPKNQFVPLDPVSPNSFDQQYHRSVLANNGMMGSDRTLATDARTVRVVKRMLGGTNGGQFFVSFAISYAKMAKTGILSGSQGEIRKKCGYVN